MRNNVTFADLVAIARRVGVKVMEAPSSHRGKKGSMGTVRGLTCHHTGTPNSYRPTVDYPDFNVVKEGRPGLENSLSAWGVGRFEAIYVFSEFLSWHAGLWNWKGLTDGNGDFLGIEVAGVGDWTEWQRKVYPRLVAAALLFLGEGIDMAPRHMDGAMPRGRKTDAANLTGDFYQGKSFYQWVEFFMANPEYININYQEDDMFTDSDRESVAEARRMLGVILLWNAPASENEREALRRIYGQTPVPDVDEAAVAEAIINRLPNIDLAQLSDADVERIAEASAKRIGKKLTDAQ